MSGRASRHVHALVVAEIAKALPATAPIRRLCLGCGERRPRFRYRQAVRADADHTLCFQCFRALEQRLRALRMKALTRTLAA